jgi:hypothetical protein
MRLALPVFMPSMRRAVCGLAAALLVILFVGSAAAQASSTATGPDTPIGPTFYWLYNFHSGKCISVPNSSTANNQALWQYGCLNQQNFGWSTVTGFSGNEYFFRNEHSGKCLAVENSSTSSGATIVQQTCNLSNPSANQRFTFVQLEFSNGYTWDSIQGVQSGLCLNVKGNSTADKASIVQFSCNASPNFNEWFIFVKAGTHLPCPCTNVADADQDGTAAIVNSRRSAG